MKLLFVTHASKNMLVFRSELLNELSQDHEVYVMCPLDESCVRFEKLGAKHVPWNLVRAELWNAWAAIRDFTRNLRTIAPDKTIVYCQQPILYFLLASYMTSCKEFFPVFTGLGSLFTNWQPPTIRKRILRWCVKKFYGFHLGKAKKILVLNEDDKREISRWNKCLESKTIKTRGEGIDCDEFQPLALEEKIKLKAAKGIAGNPLVVSYIGRFIGEKGFLDFLELVKQVPAESGVKFVIAGSSDPGNPSSIAPEIVERFCKENSVLNLGWLADVKEALNITDVFSFPSYYKEGLPIAPQEAMAMGICVVGYRGTGLSELFSGIDDSDLMSPGDVRGLAQRIEKEAELQKINMKLRTHIQQNYSLEVCNACFRAIVEI